MKKVLMASLIAGLLSTSLAQQDRTGWPSELRFGVIPQEGSQDATNRYQPLVNYLSKTLNLPIKFYVGADYAAVIIAMQSKQIDLAEFGPNSYVDAAEKSGAQALVKYNLTNGGLGYNSMLITKSSSPIKSVAEAKGKTFSFVDPESTSGYLIPSVYFLKDLKIKPADYFSRVIFSGTHEASILAVANNKVDLGATNNFDLDLVISKGVVKREDIRVLWTSSLIPNDPICARKDLPQSLKIAIKNALLKFNDPDGLAKLGMKAFVEAQDSDYNAIRDAREVKRQLSGN